MLKLLQTNPAKSARTSWRRFTVSRAFFWRGLIHATPLGFPKKLIIESKVPPFFAWKNGREGLFYSSDLILVGGFNPFEKYESKWESSPNRDEHIKYLKPPLSIVNSFKIQNTQVSNFSPSHLQVWNSKSKAESFQCHSLSMAAWLIRNT